MLIKKIRGADRGVIGRAGLAHVCSQRPKVMSAKKEIR